MSKVLFSFNWEKEKPILDDILLHFGFQKDSVDLSFGVAEIDLEDKLFCILIESDQLGDIKKIEGGHSNPKIAPFDLNEDEQSDS